MNKSEQLAEEVVDSQAAQYVARLYSGEMSALEEKALLAWLDADPVHRNAYEKTMQIWDAAGELVDDKEMLAVETDRRESAMYSRIGPRYVAIALLVLIGTVAGGVYLAPGIQSMFPDSLLVTYETSVGEQRRVSLEDGSKIVLNTRSRVLVDYSKHERRILLDFGEVYFDVAKDPNRPMSVSVGDRVVKVVGTKFSVTRSSDLVEVAVVEGVVAVGKGDSRFPRVARTPTGADASRQSASAGFSDRQAMAGVILGAGAIAEFHSGGHEVTTNNVALVERLQSWRSGIIRVDNEPLIRFVAEINRYSPVRVLIEDSSITDLPISGVFRFDDVDFVLSSIEEVVPIVVVRHPDRYVVLGREAEPIQTMHRREKKR